MSTLTRLASFTLLLGAVACAEAAASPGAVDVGGLYADLHTGPAEPVLDVRTPAEFAEGHVPGAINIPLDQLPARASELAALGDAPFYVICRSGARSQRAVDLLVPKGLKAIQVDGGTLAWIAAGHPIEK